MAALPIGPGEIGLTQQNSIFTFTLNSFTITETRSLHKDTDFVAISVAVGSNPPHTLPTKSMGDLNNGTFHVNLSIPDIEVLPNEAVAFVYSIVNTGFAQNTVEQKISAAAASAATQGAAAGGKALGTVAAGPAGGFIGNIVGSAAGGWLAGKILGLVFPDCDGPVAGATHTYSGAQLANQTADGRVLSVADNNAGTDSPDGCGKNSRYIVNWSISGRPRTIAILPH
jgi:hypothetical protein